MAATPTTKSQVQAYRFVLKRMESALVRRDAVMLHDPMRTHVRAGVVGLCLALLAAAGFLIYGFIKPKETLTQDGIVIGKDSGSMFVYSTNPSKRLIPVTNLASARLIMVKLSSSSTAEPKQVSDAVLRDVPRTPLAGIPGAPNDIPKADELVEPKWSVCDTTRVNESLPDQRQLEQAEITTTAVAGVDRLGPALGDDQALLVRSAQNKKYYLVFDGKRAEVDLADPAVTLALNLGPGQADRRPVSNGLLNAIPEVPALIPPAIPDTNGATTGYSVENRKIGAVVRTERAEGEKFYVLLRSGVQEIKRSVANLIQAQNSRDISIPSVPLGVITEAPPAADTDRIAIDDYPLDVPTVVPVRESTVACLYWQYRDGKQQTAITTADSLVLPRGQQPVQLAQADGRGENLDLVFLPPGRGASVQGVVPDQPEGTGTIFLVTDQGTKFGVPNSGTMPAADLAHALGLSAFVPAPEAILRLLPSGPALDPDQAVRTFDTLDTVDGAGARLELPNQNGGG